MSPEKGPFQKDISSSKQPLKRGYEYVPSQALLRRLSINHHHLTRPWPFKALFPAVFVGKKR